MKNDSSPIPERRAHSILKTHWDKLRAGRAYPREADIDPDAIPDIWPDCFLLQIKRNSPLRYSYVGQRLLTAYGQTPEGKQIHEDLLDLERPHLSDEVTATVLSGVPTPHEGEFTNHDGVLIQYRRILCPFGPEPGTVDFILGCMRWRLR